MGNVRNIYFNVENNKRLNEVSNISGLINDLLTNYFKTHDLNNENVPIESLKTQRDLLKLDMEKQLVSKGFVDHDLKLKFDKLIAQIENREEKEEEEQEKAEADKQRKVSSFTDSFLMLFDISKEEAIKYANKYYELNLLGKKNISVYGKEMGLKENPEMVENEEIKEQTTKM